ncbi:hypothetical protein OAS93_02660 [Gammaproteobacteria bacterium]|nr:hypothetical protein [Gammaproteobacteria bacterium]
MIEDTPIQKREYLIANAYIEIATCLIDDIDTFVSDNSPENIANEKDRVFQNYKSAFYYLNKAKDIDINKNSKQYKALKLSIDFANYYLNRKSLKNTIHFDSLDSDLQNSMTIYSLEEQLKFLKNLSTLLNKSDPIFLESKIAFSYLKSMKCNMRLVLEEFSKKDYEEFLDLKHSVFEDLRKSIDLSSNVIRTNSYQEFIVNQMNCFKEENLKIVFDSKEEAASHYINIWSMIFHGWRDMAKSTYDMLKCVATGVDDKDNQAINEYVIEHAFLLRSSYERSKFVLFACNETLIEDKLLSGIYNEPTTMLVH